MKEIYLIFDKEELFEQEIQPVMDHLKSLLLHYDLPFFFAVAVESDENGTKYIYESHDVWSTSRHMKDDIISGFIKVVNGLKTVLPGSFLNQTRRNDMLLYLCGCSIPSVTI